MTTYTHNFFSSEDLMFRRPIANIIQNEDGSATFADEPTLKTSALILEQIEARRIDLLKEIEEKTNELVALRQRLGFYAVTESAVKQKMLETLSGVKKTVGLKMEEPKEPEEEKQYDHPFESVT